MEISVQDKLEKILREIHVLFSNCEAYEQSKDRIIVSKKEVYDLLNSLNVCIYEIMDAYEMTSQSRDKAERQAKKKGEQLIKNASLKAEDVYAASVLYTNDALNRIQDIMQYARESVKDVYEQMESDMKDQQQVIKENQSELKEQLQDMVDTEKYLGIIEDVNKKREKGKLEKKDGKIVRQKPKGEKSVYASVKPEIKINKAYFEQNGIPYDEEEKEKQDLRQKPDPQANLDAEYFQWKEGQEQNGSDSEEEQKRHFFFKKK